MKLSASSLIASFAVFALPLMAGAQTSSDGSLDSTNLGTLFGSVITFINDILIPFIFAVAFIVFIWGVFQYFIAGGANEEKREQGKQLVMWGIIGFFVMVSVWGLVTLVRNTLGFNETNSSVPPLPRFDPPPAP